MTMYGADADELDKIASAMQSAADDLADDTGFLSRMLNSVPWVGGVAKAFLSSWESNHARRLDHAVQFLRVSAEGLTKNAAQQREASNRSWLQGGAAAAPPTTRSAHPHSAVRAVADKLRSLDSFSGPNRPDRIARAIQQQVEKSGAPTVTKALASLLREGGVGADVFNDAVAGVWSVGMFKSLALQNVLKNADIMANQPPALPAPPSPPTSGGSSFVSGIRELGEILRRGNVVMPWSKPFVFENCYPIRWDNVRLVQR